MTDMHFMGKPVEYWVGLQELIYTKGLPDDLIEEIIRLRGKVSYYESRIKEMAGTIDGS